MKVRLVKKLPICFLSPRILLIHIEKTLTENQSIREDNNALAIIGISAAFIILGIAIYLANEEYKDRQKYSFIVP